MTEQLSAPVGIVHGTVVEHCDGDNVTILFEGQVKIVGLMESMLPGAQQTSPPSLLVISTIENCPEVLPGNSLLHEVWNDVW